MTDYTDLCAQGEAAMEGATCGRAVQFHPNYCDEAKGTSVTEWDTSHDLSIIRPDGSRYRVATFRHADDAAVAQWCWNNVPALIAAIRDLEARVGVWKSAAQNHAEWQLAAEATVAPLTAQIEAMRGELATMLRMYGDAQAILKGVGVEITDAPLSARILAALTTKKGNT